MKWFIHLEQYAKGVKLFIQQLVWSMGSRHSIIIGVDQILGIGGDYCFSDTLLAFLYDHDIFLWNQLIKSWRDRYPIQKTSHELGMASNLAMEWKHVCVGYKVLGICQEDIGIKWCGRGK